MLIDGALVAIIVSIQVACEGELSEVGVIVLAVWVFILLIVHPVNLGRPAIRAWGVGVISLQVVVRHGAVLGLETAGQVMVGMLREVCEVGRRECADCILVALIVAVLAALIVPDRKPSVVQVESIDGVVSCYRCSLTPAVGGDLSV